MQSFLVVACAILVWDFGMGIDRKKLFTVVGSIILPIA